GQTAGPGCLPCNRFPHRSLVPRSAPSARGVSPVVSFRKGLPSFASAPGQSRLSEYLPSHVAAARPHRTIESTRCRCLAPSHRRRAPSSLLSRSSWSASLAANGLCGFLLRPPAALCPLAERGLVVFLSTRLAA